MFDRYLLLLCVCFLLFPFFLSLSASVHPSTEACEWDRLILSILPCFRYACPTASCFCTPVVSLGLREPCHGRMLSRSMCDGARRVPGEIDASSAPSPSHLARCPLGLHSNRQQGYATYVSWNLYWSMSHAHVKPHALHTPPWKRIRQGGRLWERESVRSAS